jgi:hypothetical protein
MPQLLATESGPSAREVVPANALALAGQAQAGLAAPAAAVAPQRDVIKEMCDSVSIAAHWQQQATALIDGWKQDHVDSLLLCSAAAEP